jgi:hypothetical protein
MGLRRKPSSSNDQSHSQDPQSTARWFDKSHADSKARAESRGSGPVADANCPQPVGDQPRSGEGTAKRRWL